MMPSFCGRVYLDLTGSLPSESEVLAFTKDRDPAKRDLVIEGLLERPEYAEFWAQNGATCS